MVFIFNILLLVKKTSLQIKSKGLIHKKWKKDQKTTLYEVSSMKSLGTESKKTIAIEQQCYSTDYYRLILVEFVIILLTYWLHRNVLKITEVIIV